jgi:hypothetical protein
MRWKPYSGCWYVCSFIGDRNLPASHFHIRMNLHYAAHLCIYYQNLLAFFNTSQHVLASPRSRWRDLVLPMEHVTHSSLMVCHENETDETFGKPVEVQSQLSNPCTSSSYVVPVIEHTNTPTLGVRSLLASSKSTLKWCPQAGMFDLRSSTVLTSDLSDKLPSSLSPRAN